MNIILVVFLIAIWAWIARSLVDVEEGTEFVVNTTEFTEVQPPKTSYTLKLNYRDPFLGKTRRAYVNKQTGTTTPKAVKPGSVKTQPWPSVAFYGCIKKPEYAQALGVMKVNAKSVLVSKGQQLEDIRVISIAVDSILLELNKERRWFYANKTSV